MAHARRFHAFEVPDNTPADVRFHLIGVALNAGATSLGVAWLAVHAETAAAAPLAMTLAVLAGLFAGDFVSGLLHWAFDTWFDTRRASLLRMVLIVREHHVYPGNIFKYPFHEECGPVSWAAFVFTLPLYLAALLVLGPTPAGLACALACVTLSGCTVFMLQLHKLGHRKARWRVTRALQRGGLLMSPQHHAQHHRGAHDVRYCLINGWADHVCDAIGFWRLAERAIARVTGARPRHDDRAFLARYGRASG